MTINFKKTLLAGTAVFALGGLVVASATPAFAQGEIAVDTNNSNDGVYETDRNSALDFTADDDRDIRIDADATIDVDDTETIGNADTTVSGIVFASARTLTLIDGNDDTGTITANIVDGISLDTGVASGVLLISGDVDGNGGDPFVVNIDGDVNLGTGTLDLRADADSNNTVTVTLSSNLTADAVSMNSAGITLTFDGAQATTVTSTIDGGGDVNVNTTNEQITFENGIGLTTAIDVLGIGNGNVSTDALFLSSVTAGSIALGAAANANDNEAVFMGSNQNITVTGAITGVEAGDTNTVGVQGTGTAGTSGTVTFANNIGAGGNIDEILLESTSRAVFNGTVQTSSAITFQGADTRATFNGNITSDIVFQSNSDGAATSGIATIGDTVTTLTGTVDNTTGVANRGTLNFETGGTDVLDVTGNIGATNALSAIAMTSASGGVVKLAGTVAANTITLSSGGSLDLRNTTTATTVTMGTGSTLRKSGAGNFSASITGSATGDTVMITNGATVGNVAGNELDLAAGDDTFSVEGGATINFVSGFDGGAGTDVFLNSAGNNTLAADMVNFESVRIGAGQLTLTGTISNSPDLVFNGTGTLVINNPSGASATQTTIFRTFTGSGAADTVTITDGNLEVADGNSIDLGGGNDVITLTSGRIGRTDSDNTLDLGLGDDTINLDGGILYASVEGGGGTDTIEVSGTATIANTVDTNVAVNLDTGGASVLTIDLTDSDLERTDFDASVTDSGAGIERLNLIGVTMDGAITLGASGAASDILNVSASTLNGAVTDGAAGDIDVTFSGGTSTVAGTFTLDAAGSTTTIADGATAQFTTNGSTYDLGASITLQSSGDAARIVLGSNSTVVTNDITVTDGIIEFQADGSDDDDNLNVGTLNLTGGTVTFVSTNRLQLEVSGSVALGSANIITNAAAGALVVPDIDDTFLWDFTVTNNAGTINLAVASNNELSDLGGVGGGAGGVGSVVQTLITDPTADEDFQDFATLINTAGRSQAQIEEDIESVAPTVDGSAQVAIAGAMGQSSGVVSTRLASLRTGSGTSGMAAGDLSQGLKVWSQAFGASGEQDERQGIDGYDFTTYGVAAGIDTQGVAENLTLGVAFSYADTDADSDNANSTETETDTYLFTLYGDYQFGDGIYASGQLGYGWSDIERNRFNVAGVAGRTANGDFDANQWLANAEVGRDYMMDNGLIITPIVSAAYAAVDADSFTETGAGAFNIQESSDTNSSFEMGLGVDFSGQIQQPNGDYIKPHLSLGYRYEFLEDEVETSGSFTGGGGSFTAEGFKPEQHRFDIGAGLTYLSTTNWEFQAEYNFDTREDYSAHSGFVRAAYKF